MNLQSVTVIFVIIFLPIILISNYFIQREMDTINIQNYYDTKLIDATTDAISAFELNTANEDLSLIPDSLRGIVEASTNVFTTTLATNLGISSASKNKILPYIPAIVFTLYDGYYIYSPTQQPKVLVNVDGVYVKVGDAGVSYNGTSYVYNPGSSDTISSDDLRKNNLIGDFGKMLYSKTDKSDPNNDNNIECTVDPNEAYFVTNYILKSFIPYSMQYKKTGSYDVTINYTLDNYISVKGNITTDDKQVFYTKSGYLINLDDIEEIRLAGHNMNEFKSTSEITEISLDTIDGIIDSVVANNAECYVKFKNGIKIDTKEASETSKTSTGKETLDNVSAVKYYIKAYMFSSWVREHIGNLAETDIPSTAKELQEDFSIKQNGFSLEKNSKIFFDYGNSKIFETNGSWNINDVDSNFIEHKRRVIKNSIQYNLNLAMAVYNAGQGDEYYQMPILSDAEWDKVMSNVSMIAFMQGFPCGMKTYNNYALITSTKNEIMTNKKDIYYIPISNNSDGTYTDKEIQKTPSVDLDTAHKIDCVESDWVQGVESSNRFQSFSAKDLKYDKVYDYSTGKYEYDHVANECYYCIVNPNYDSALKDAIGNVKAGKSIDGVLDGKLKNYGISNSTEFVNKLLKAELIADAKIKNNTFKSIASTTNYGIRTENFADGRNMVFNNFKGEQSTKTEKVDIPNAQVQTMFFPVQDRDNLKNCYEIDITISVNQPSIAGYTDPFVRIYLGNEEKKQVFRDEGVYTLRYTNPNLWGDEFLLKLVNPANNFVQTRNASNEIVYDSIIKNGNISIKSITFKYK